MNYEFRIMNEVFLRKSGYCRADSPDMVSDGSVGKNAQLQVRDEL